MLILALALAASAGPAGRVEPLASRAFEPGEFVRGAALDRVSSIAWCDERQRFLAELI